MWRVDQAGMGVWVGGCCVRRRWVPNRKGGNKPRGEGPGARDEAHMPQPPWGQELPFACSVQRQAQERSPSGGRSAYAVAGSHKFSTRSGISSWLFTMPRQLLWPRSGQSEEMFLNLIIAATAPANGLFNHWKGQKQEPHTRYVGHPPLCLFPTSQDEEPPKHQHSACTLATQPYHACERAAYV